MIKIDGIGLTRTDAAQLLGTSVAAVRRLEGIKLFPETIAGLDRFRPSEIAAILKTPLPLSKPVPPKPGRPRRSTQASKLPLSLLPSPKARTCERS